MKNLLIMLLISIILSLVSCKNKTDPTAASNDPVYVSGITLNATELYLSTGDTYNITAKVEPANAIDKTVSWTSSNPSVAAVSSDGLVSAKTLGTSVITATTTDGEKTAVCTVSISDKPVVDEGYYKIYTKKQLVWLTTAANQSEISSSINNIKIMNDIDMTGETYVSGITIFSKTFDGNNKKIKNLKINNAKSAALIRNLQKDGKIQNLTLENVSIKGELSTGSFVGDNYGTVDNCKNIGGTVTGTIGSTVGGIAGWNSGVIENSYNTGSVISIYNLVGGITGGNGKTSIVRNCYNMGSVTGKDDIGGVVGKNSGSIENSYNIGSVTGINNSRVVGGIAGLNSGVVENSYNTGSITGSLVVGGVIGENYSTAKNCYNIGSVTADRFPGGGVGSQSGGKIIDCYFIKTEDINNSIEGVGNSSDQKVTPYTIAQFANLYTISPFNTSPWIRGAGLGGVAPERPVLAGIGAGSGR